MKNHKVSEEFILEAHKSACSEWKQKLEKEFPEVFDSKIEIGRWYKTRNGSLFCLSSLDGDVNKGYGFTPDGYWDDNRENNYYFGHKSKILREATDEEVEEALLAEAKRRGFEVGVRFKGMYKVGNLRNGIFLFNCPQVGLCLIDKSKDDGNYIFWYGNWAEIIDDKSELKEEIKSLEEKLKELRSKL